jgi:peroxidase
MKKIKLNLTKTVKLSFLKPVKKKLYFLFQGHREQLNLLTSFLDLSATYGSSQSRASELRTFQGGQMKTSDGINLKRFLPTAQDGACRQTDQTVRCFAGGDGRINENMALTSVHLLFVREHNRLASELAKINPQWADERLYSETRKIMIGIFQHIVYSEYLPALIGFNNAGVFDLVPLSSKKYYSGYNPNVICPYYSFHRKKKKF